MKTVIVAIVLLAATTIAPATYAKDDGEINITAGIDGVSEYVFRGKSLGGNSIQPFAEVSAVGFSVGAWYSTGIGSDSNIQANEWNLYAGYAVPLKGPVSIGLGATYYYYPDNGSLFEINNGYTGSVELSGSVGLDDIFLSPSASLYYDITLENLTAEASIGHSFDLPVDGWSTDLGLTTGHVEDNGPFDYRWTTATVALNTSFADNVDFYLSGNFTVNSEDYSLGFERVEVPNFDFAYGVTRDDTLFWAGTGISVSF